MSSNPSFIAAVTIQKEPVISEIPKVFILFFLQLLRFQFCIEWNLFSEQNKQFFFQTSDSFEKNCPEHFVPDKIWRAAQRWGAGTVDTSLSQLGCKTPPQKNVKDEPRSSEGLLYSNILREIIDNIGE